jgi:hypothetical protein
MESSIDVVLERLKRAGLRLATADEGDPWRDGRAGGGGESKFSSSQVRDHNEVQVSWRKGRARSRAKLTKDSQPDLGTSSDQSIRRVREKNEKIQAALEEAMLKIKDQAAQLAEEVGLGTQVTVSYR